MPSVKATAFVAPALPQVQQVPLPEAGEGCYVCIRELGAKDLVDLRGHQGRTGDTDHLPFVYDLLSRVLCDDAGTLLFADADVLRANFGLSVKTLTRLADEACRISGLSSQEKN